MPKPLRAHHQRWLPALLLCTLLLGCASPLPAITWVRLPAEVPGFVAPTAPSPARRGEVWQLMAAVQLPGHLDQEALLLPQGAAGLQPLGGTRWAEPLRDAVPRLLRDDLARWLGAPLWAAPLPPGLLPTVQLRLAFSAFDVAADGQGVDLRASWSLADPAGASAPRVFEATIKQPALALTGQNQAQALASAHRQALARLAQHIAESAR